MVANRIIFFIGVLLIIFSFYMGAFFTAEKLEEKFLISSIKSNVDEISNDLKTKVIEPEFVKFKLLPCSTNCEFNNELLEKIKNTIAFKGLLSFQILNEAKTDLLNYGRSLNANYNPLFGKAFDNDDAAIAEATGANPNEKNNLVYLKKISVAQNINYYLLLRFEYVESEYITAKFFNTVFVSLFILGVILVITYSSKTKEIEASFEQIEKLKDELRSIKADSNSQNQFIANFTHELRTPLNSIIGFSGMLKDETLGTLGNPEYVKFANEINGSGIHLLSIINDILDFSKAESGNLKVNLVETDITKIIRQCLGIIAPRAAESKVELLEDMASTTYISLADGKRFKQVILNLLSNAVKFTPEGGSVTVSIYHEIKNEKLFVEIKDTGVGIAEKDLATVMTLFGQVENKLSRKYEGTGIGLPFSKKLTNLMGGEFEIKSKIGEGTNVILTFPFDKNLNSTSKRNF
jgi:signal transduction histidine kinase